VIIEKIRCIRPIPISPLKMGTKNPKKKYVQEYPMKPDLFKPESECFRFIRF